MLYGSTELGKGLEPLDTLRLEHGPDHGALADLPEMLQA